MRSARCCIFLVTAILTAFCALPAFANSKASIGGSEYATLQAAFNSATENDIVTLQQDVDVTEPVEIYNKTLVLDLNGHSINGANASGNVLSIENCRLTIVNSGKDGKIIGPTANLDESSFGTHSTLRLKSESRLTLEDGVTLCDSNLTAAAPEVEIQGGAIFVSGSSSLTIHGGTITNNRIFAGVSGKAYGAGIYLSGGSSMVLSGGNITDNSIASGSAEVVECGAGICAKNDARITILDGNISNNSISVPQDSYGLGAALYLGSHSSLSMFDGTISENSVETTALATCFGGGIYSEGNAEMASDIALYGGKITKNAATSGAGVYAANGTRLSLFGDTGISENAATDGGGVYLSGTNSQLYLAQNATISDNTASASGGGAYISAAKLMCFGGSISGNSSTNTSTLGGGGVYANLADVYIQNCNISSNTADNSGGGMYLDASTLKLNGGSISGNVSGWYGGGLVLDGGSEARINGGEISENEVRPLERAHDAVYGGGIALLDGFSSLRLDGGKILRNSALDENASADKYGYGGGIYTAFSPVIATSGEISANVSGRGGAIFGGNGSVVTLVNPFIARNSASYAGGGIAVSSSGNLVVSGLTELPFADNKADGFGDTVSIAYAAQPSRISPRVIGYGMTKWSLDGNINNADEWGIVEADLRDYGSREYDAADLAELSGKGLRILGGDANRAEKAAKLRLQDNTAVYGGGIAAMGDLEIVGVGAEVLEGEST